MKTIRYLLPAMAGALIGLSVTGANAQDASFGCKILLCVASQNPLLARCALLRAARSETAGHP